MGGQGSGRFEGGSRQVSKTAMAVCGSGVPERPYDMPEDVAAAWEMIVSLTAGVTFEQDSMAIAELAETWAEQQKVLDALHGMEATDAAYDKLTKTRQANSRQMNTLWHAMGLTPRGRQSLSRPTETEELDELEQLRGG